LMFLAKFYSEESSSAAGAARQFTPTLGNTTTHTVTQAATSALNHFTYQSLCVSTNNFCKRLGGGGCRSFFQGTLASGTQVAVKRLHPHSESSPEVAMGDQIDREVDVLSRVQHPNIVPVLGLSKDGVSPCLVYALMEGGSLQDSLACTHGAAVLTSKERILVLSDVARGLAYLHSEIFPPVIHSDVKSANVFLDRPHHRFRYCARIGDFGILAKSPVNGDMSTRVDSFAFGIVVLETLTGYPVHVPQQPAPGHQNLLSMFKDTLDTRENLLLHLDKRACWDQHNADIATLYSIAEGCLEMRLNSRLEMVSLIPELEALRRSTVALPLPELERSSGQKECVVCLGTGGGVTGWMMLRPCGHVCVCMVCAQGLQECPICRGGVSDSFEAFV
jgi:serine/threonine protein kinase